MRQIKIVIPRRSRGTFPHRFTTRQLLSAMARHGSVIDTGSQVRRLRTAGFGGATTTCQRRYSTHNRTEQQKSSSAIAYLPWVEACGKSNRQQNAGTEEGSARANRAGNTQHNGDACRARPMLAGVQAKSHHEADAEREECRFHKPKVVPANGTQSTFRLYRLMQQDSEAEDPSAKACGSPCSSGGHRSRSSALMVR